MTNKIKCNIALIESYRKAVSDAANESTHCETALSEAERDAENASHDDAKIAPEELYERSELARKNVFLRKTEASRAAERLEKIKAEFEAALKGDANAIITALEARIQEATASLKEQLSPLISKGDSHSAAALDAFIRQCDEVAMRQNALRFLRLHHETHTTAENFNFSIEAAVKLL